jgi:transcriptional regulator with XRE-family HTH domain
VRVPVDRGTGRVSHGGPRRVYPAVVDTKSEIREFLTSRRARITPEQVGLPSYGSRRVPGLRREEVAVLAGVSVPYYTRLERGDPFRSMVSRLTEAPAYRHFLGVAATLYQVTPQVLGGSARHNERRSGHGWPKSQSATSPGPNPASRPATPTAPPCQLGFRQAGRCDRNPAPGPGVSSRSPQGWQEATD